MFNSTSPFPMGYFYCLNGIHFGLIFLYCVMIFCCLLGIPANLWCLWFFINGGQKVKETQFFSLNYIILELMLCVECAAEMLNMFIFKNDILCLVIYLFLNISLSGRPLIQTCICIEHYLAVCHPVTFLRYKGIKYKIAAVAVVCGLSFGYTLYQLISKAFPNPVINSVYIIALAVISCSCVSVLCALKKPGPGDMRNQRGRDVGNQKKRNAFNIIFSMLLLILFSYLPQALLSIFTADNTDYILLECSITPFMASFNVFSVIITPFLKIYKEGHLKCLNCQTKN